MLSGFCLVFVAPVFNLGPDIGHSGVGRGGGGVVTVLISSQHRAYTVKEQGYITTGN